MSSAIETLTARVLRHARTAGDAPALQTDGEQAESYSWLANEVERSATAMHGMGVGHGTRVLIDATRRATYVVQLLASWYLGASVVPLARGLTPETEASMLAQLGAIIDLRGVELDAPLGDVGPATLHASDEAYVFFTSGSSGAPKGVRIGHGGLPQLFAQQSAVFGVTESARTSWMLAGHFDASISDIGVPLWSGACLVIWSGETSMFDFIGARGLTHIDLPPSQLPALVARGLPPTLETLVVGGEPAAPEALRAAARLVRVVNVYGPTETTVCASAEVIDPERVGDGPSLGHPLPGVSFHTSGGELWISGWGVGLGYLGEQQDAFVQLDDGATRAYRTGDLVEPMADGSFRFLGRADRQVQLRGQRLELGEVEQALLRAPGVTEAAAVYIDAPAPHVVAFVVGPAVDSAAESLQEWKRPARILSLPTLPRLANNKVDFTALTRLAQPNEASDAPPLDPLARAWCYALGRKSALDADDFFESGGDSVSALELSVEAAALGIAVEPEAIFEHPRLGDLRTALTRGVTVAELRSRSDAAFAALRLERRQPHKSARGVLLTGGTGMLGLQLLKSGDLSDRPVFVLVRGKSVEHGTERLERLLGARLGDKVRVLRGDLGLDGLGLDEKIIRELAPLVSEVIHAAGAVDLVRSYASLRDVHVGGTGRVMEVAARLGARLHHVSTLSIFVESDLPGGVIVEGQELEPSRRIFGGYAQSKWVADDLAQRFPQGGSVLRLGLLTAEEGAAPPMDQLSRVIRGASVLGAWPSERDACSFDVTPVSCAARLVVKRLEEPSAQPSKPVHLANSTSATGAELRRAMEAEGIALESPDSWPPRTKSRASDADRAVALAALTARAQGPNGARPALPRSGDLFLTTVHRFDCPTVREEYPDALPPAPTEEGLRALVRIALGSPQAAEVLR